MRRWLVRQATSTRAMVFSVRLSVKFGTEDSGDDREKVSSRKAAHENAGHALEGSEEAPARRQDQVSIPDRGVGRPGKVEGGSDVGQAVEQVVGDRPERDADAVETNEKPRRAGEKPGD